MDLIWIILISIVAAAIIFVFGPAAVCYLKVFYAPKRKKHDDDFIDLPPGKSYEPFYPDMIEWTKRARSTPHKKVEMVTFDGLTLRGRYYEVSPNAPIEIMMHGYQGNMERDLSGGVFRAMDIGHNVLAFNHRGCGDSDGNCQTFGIMESRDCRMWIDYVINNINKDAKIILSGVSMGAATAMITSGFDDLPDNVVGIIADCGYTSAKEIVKKVVSDIHLPADFLYPFVKLGAKLFGHFDLDELSPIEQVKKSKIPTIFVHGEIDDLVPTQMSERNYEACAAPVKKLLFIKDANHGLAFPVAREGYLDALREFFDPIINK